jgi:hypothetical protein
LKGIVNSLKGKKLLEEETSEIIMNNFGKNRDLIDRLFKKVQGSQYPKYIQKI